MARTATTRNWCHVYAIECEIIYMSKRQHFPYRDWAEGKQMTTVAYKPSEVELLGRMIPVHRAIEAALITEFHPRLDPSSGRAWFVR
jgi:hypothetical protein